MERRNFIRDALLGLGGLLLGGAGYARLREEKAGRPAEGPTFVEEIHRGTGRNVLVLMGSGTRQGNTDRLTDAYIKGLREGDHTITKVQLGQMRLQGCRGCGACQRHGRGCVVRDDMQRLYPLFERADVVVMASPLYFWTLTAPVKAFIERLYAISVDDKYPTKGMVLLMTAGDDADGTFATALSYFRTICGVFGGRELGHYCAGGCTGCEELGRKIAPRHLDAAYRLGRTLT